MNRLLSAVLAAAFTVLLFVSPDSAADGVIHGIDICKDILLPSSFLFMIISCFISLCGACEYLTVLFIPVTKLLKLPKETAGVWLSAFIGGLPSGAHSVCALYKLGVLSKSHSEQLISCSVCSGPAFLILAVGKHMLGSVNLGIILYASQIISVILLTAIFCRSSSSCSSGRISCYMPFDSALVMAVANSCSAIINIFAFVIFFSAVTELLKDSFSASAFIIPLFEITLGCEHAALIKESFSLPLIAFISGFGGFSVCFQILSIAKNVGLSPVLFWRIRFLNGILCSAITALLCKLFPLSAAVFSASPQQSVIVWSVDRILGGICLAAMLVMSMQRLDFNIQK